jgi:hypothetical protein
MSISCDAKRKATSPSAHRISSRLVRNVIRGCWPGRALALVVMQLRVLQWIKSGSCAAAPGVLRVFMEMKSPRLCLELPAMPHAGGGTFWNDLGPRCNAVEGAP